MNDLDRQDFDQAMGESFASFVSPPVQWEDASPHECCEAIWTVLGFDVTPELLASLNNEKIEDIRIAFGTYFECEQPTTQNIIDAIAATLSRWPIGSTD